MIKKVGKILVEKITEKIKAEIEKESKFQISEFVDKHVFDNYKDNIYKELLEKYGDEPFYNDLCNTLLRNNNLEILLERCKNHNILDDKTDIDLINQIMQENCMIIYNKSEVKKCLEGILKITFKTFNELKDPENIMLKNIIINESDRVSCEIKQYQKQSQDEIIKEIKALNTMDKISIDKKATNKITVTAQNKNIIASDITKGCKNTVKHFLGREDDINSILQIVENDTKDEQKSSIWVYGMGGMGKTQLCRKLYSIFQRYYQYIGWITIVGDFKESLINSINLHKNIDDLEKEYLEIINFLNSLGRQLVIFIDNYDVCDKYFKDIEALQCHVIITSRSKSPDTFNGYELGFLSFPDCKKLFRCFYTLEDNIIMNEIIYKTGYLALAVELVAKTGEKMALPLKEYYEKLVEKGFDIKTIVQSNWDNTGEKLNVALSMHFGIVFDLTSLSKNPEAIHILKNFSVLPYLGITQQEAVNWFGLNLEQNYLYDLVDLGWLQRIDFEYTMHPIISYTVKKSIPPVTKDCCNLINNLSHLIKILPGDNYLNSFMYLPYADSVGSYFIKRKETKEYKLLSILYIRIAEIYRDRKSVV